MAKKTPAQRVREKAATLPSSRLRRGYRQGKSPAFRAPTRRVSSMRGRVRRKSYYLNFMPRTGMFCVAKTVSTAGYIHPLACHGSFQDALYDENIPEHQGTTSRRGSKRNIRCVGTQVTGTKNVPYERDDGLPIFEIRRCSNQTKYAAWDPDEGWVKTVDHDLASLGFPKTARGAAQLGTYAGMAIAGLGLWGLLKLAEE